MWPLYMRLCFVVFFHCWKAKNTLLYLFYKRISGWKCGRDFLALGRQSSLDLDTLAQFVQKSKLITFVSALTFLCVLSHIFYMTKIVYGNCKHYLQYVCRQKFQLPYDHISFLIRSSWYSHLKKPLKSAQYKNESYWPPTFRSWFLLNGTVVIWEQK